MVLKRCFKNIINRSMKKSIFNSLIVLITVTLIITLYSCSSDDATTGTPTIASFTPSGGGAANTYVKITGTFFSTDATKNTVKFGGTTASVISANKSEIVTLVPAGASSGKITVTVGASTASSPTDFVVSSGKAAPIITKVDPATGSGADGTEVTITGYNFSATPEENTVKFNGVVAVPTKASATSLTVKVPSGATTGKITVDVSGSTKATSDSDFSVPAPTVDSFSPTSSIVGSTVVITGTNFSKTASKNIVKFGDVTAEVLDVNVETATANKITTKVPVGAITAPISVSVDGQVTKGGEFNLPHTLFSFTPLSGNATTSVIVNGTETVTDGTEVTLTGTNFSASLKKNVVKFNGKEAAVTSVSSDGTTLKVIVPKGATTGKITVTINSLTVTSALDFTVN